jgi:hypothetical protein
MSRLFIAALMISILSVMGCRRAEHVPGYPVGFWEYQGELEDGRQIAMRVSIDHGPFVRGIGFVAPVRPLSEKAYTQLVQQLENAYANVPEMLMRYDNGSFYGIGSDFDGDLFYEWSPGDSRLVAHHGEAAGVVLEKVEIFRPIAFPHYERAFDRSVQPPGTPQTPSQP